MVKTGGAATVKAVVFASHPYIHIICIIQLYMCFLINYVRLYKVDGSKNDVQYAGLGSFIYAEKVDPECCGKENETNVESPSEGEVDNR